MIAPLILESSNETNAIIVNAISVIKSWVSAFCNSKTVQSNRCDKIIAVFGLGRLVTTATGLQALGATLDRRMSTFTVILASSHLLTFDLVIKFHLFS